MNKKILIWGTVITVVALGGYFVFKSVSKEEDVIDALGSTDLGELTTGSGTTPTTGAGASLLTPEQVAQVVNIANQQSQLKEVQSIASQIASLRIQSLKLFNPTPSNINVTATMSLERGRIASQIAQLSAKLKELGYKEVKGKAVKIV